MLPTLRLYWLSFSFYQDRTFSLKILWHNNSALRRPFWGSTKLTATMLMMNHSRRRLHKFRLVNVILPVKDQYVIVIFKWYFFFSSLWIFRRVSLVEQELLTFRRTWVHPWFLVARSLVFYVVFCRSLFVFRSFFLTIMLSVL
jgi:hypothetical protein